MATDAIDKKAPKSAPAPPPPPELPCPRCNSTSTKFCYYNNYNSSQPRHFCKSCRRYWTHGGTLRDIPVGGATRKSAKRPRTSSPAAAAAVFPSAAAAFYHHRHLAGGGYGAAAAVGNFTTLLNGSPAAGIFHGYDDVAGGFGIGRPAWPFAAGEGGAAAAHTWQVESGESGFVGGGDCFGFPLQRGLF